MKNIAYEEYQNDFRYLHHSRTRSKTTKGFLILFASILSVFVGIQADAAVTHQASADANTAFEVNVVDSISVSITTPSEWASGGIDTFLRNQVSIDVTSNQSNGFTASMYSKNNTTNLTNSTSGNSETLPTLASSSSRSSFPANRWGYSLGEYTLDGTTQNSYTLNGHSYGETLAGNNSSNYYPLVSTSSTPITIMDGTNKRSGTQNIYFGAKANATQAAGTYTGTVVISVVTGTINPSTNPITPTNPATDRPTSPAHNPSYAYNAGSNRTVSTYTSSNAQAGTNTTTTEVSEGDVSGSYSNPQGVTKKSSSDVSEDTSISNSTPIATALALTAGVAATTGYTFFIAANRRQRDDDEEEE